MTKPCQLREWQVKGEDFINGKKCEWCGSEKDLVIHHIRPPHNFNDILTYFRDQKIVECFKSGEFICEEKERIVCPNCGEKRSSFIRPRKRAKPRYRCFTCMQKFDGPRIELHSSSYLGKEAFERFWAKYGAGIRAKAQEVYDKNREEYMSLANCVIICNRCHLAENKRIELLAIGQG